MITNAENLAKAWILCLDPSILVKMFKENWFSRCFRSLKLALSHPFFLIFQNGYSSPFYVQVFVLHQVKTAYFHLSENPFSLQLVGSVACISI